MCGGGEFSVCGDKMTAGRGGEREGRRKGGKE